jgi:hypothetical protein
MFTAIVVIISLLICFLLLFLSSANHSMPLALWYLVELANIEDVGDDCFLTKFGCLKRVQRLREVNCS